MKMFYFIKRIKMRLASTTDLIVKELCMEISLFCDQNMIGSQLDLLFAITKKQLTSTKSHWPPSNTVRRFAIIRKQSDM